MREEELLPCAKARARCSFALRNGKVQEEIEHRFVEWSFSKKIADILPWDAGCDETEGVHFDPNSGRTAYGLLRRK
jgi:hypothetical protein